MGWVGRELIVEGLRELASRELQERRWLNSSGEVSSFIEAVESLFSDSALSEAIESGDIVYSRAIDAGLLQLEALVLEIDAERDPQTLIDDVRMADVRIKALALSESIAALQQGKH